MHNLDFFFFLFITRVQDIPNYIPTIKERLHQIDLHSYPPLPPLRRQCFPPIPSQVTFPDPFRISFSLLIPIHRITICSGVAFSSPHLGHVASSACPIFSFHQFTYALPSQSTITRNCFSFPSHHPPPHFPSSSASPTVQTSDYRGRLGHPSAACLASTSAASFPRMPMCAFTQPNLTPSRSAISLTTYRDLAFPVLPAFFTAAMAALESAPFLPVVNWLGLQPCQPLPRPIPSLNLPRRAQPLSLAHLSLQQIPRLSRSRFPTNP